MAALSQAALADLLAPYLDAADVPDALYPQLSIYLDLLLKWNARTNLTAIRKPEEIVRRHFGESLFAARHLPPGRSLLDFGSGAGFPGLPVQLLHPQLAVTLAESQNKKATFLREAIRSLDLKTEVWPSRVEAMPSASRFDVVAMRAVDAMEPALLVAASRAESALVIFTTSQMRTLAPKGFIWQPPIAMPGASSHQLRIAGRV